MIVDSSVHHIKPTICPFSFYSKNRFYWPIVRFVPSFTEEISSQQSQVKKFEFQNCVKLSVTLSWVTLTGLVLLGVYCTFFLIAIQHNCNCPMYIVFLVKC